MPETADKQGSSSKLLRLEAIRGLAAIYVVAHHTVQFEYYVLGLNLGRLLRFGQEAVILFFIVSGFVIHLSYQTGADKSFRTYFVKRFVRIYVPLLVVIGVGVIAESYNRGAMVVISPVELIGNLLMLQDWPADKPGVLVDPILGNDPLWSLAYEWWFYMLYFPLVWWVKDQQRLALGVFAAAIVASVVYTIWPNIVPRLIMYAAIWWSGVYLAGLYLQDKAITFRSCLLPLLSLLIISCVLSVKVLVWQQAGEPLFLGRYPLIEVRHTGFALSALAAAIVWHRYAWRGFDQLVGPFVVFAPVSYVIYISHYHLMVSATWFDSIGNAAITWALYFAGMLLFSWVVEIRLYPSVRRRLYARLL